MALESKFQAELIKHIRCEFPGSIVLKNDPTYLQGIPDLLILFENKWAMLETKKSKNASKRPNQEWYVNRANEMSFARFIFPENKDEVLRALYIFFKHDIKESNK